jgi:hypothetical protein
MSPEKKKVLVAGLAMAGNVAGILVAVKRKSGFWGGLGWFILGGMAGGAVGYIAAAVIPGADTTAVTENKSAAPATVSPATAV